MLQEGVRKLEASPISIVVEGSAKKELRGVSQEVG